MFTRAPRYTLVWLVACAAIAVVALAGQPEAASAAPWKRDMTPPSMPSNLRASNATQAAVTFAWDASTDNISVVGYDVYVGSNPTRLATRSLNYTVTGLACGTSVSVKVAAYDRAGNRSAAAAATGSTSGCGDSQVPTPPTSLAVTSRTDTSLALSWAPSMDNIGVAGYRYFLGTSSVGTTTATSAVFSGLKCGTTYTLGVSAFDAAGNTSTTTTVSASTAACSPSSGEPSPIAGKGYHQVFRDDFDTLNRAVWDNHIWYEQVPSAAWTNFQYAQNGILHLATSRNYGYPDNTVTTQASGRAFTQGYFEARMKWTGGHGAWPGFWLYSYRHATNPAYPAINPICAASGLSTALCDAGEIDAFEGQGSEPSAFYGTIHRNSCGCYGVGDSQNGNNWQPAGVDLTAGFHTYGMLWTASQVTWYLDGRALMSAATYDTTNQPMFLLLQMWTGGWTYNPDSTTPTTIETQVDYVQVWQK